MGFIILSVVVIGIFLLAFLIDISINIRRLDGDLKKMIKNYENVHGSPKA
ncbi:MAG: hypothetical protein NTZ63_07355 [Candidatus Omnitrophica bacterium]|nr:hypothetical protein [Candidatus Omnitrophota bacterium]